MLENEDSIVKLVWLSADKTDRGLAEEIGLRTLKKTSEFFSRNETGVWEVKFLMLAVRFWKF